MSNNGNKDASGFQQFGKGVVVNEKFANINFEEGINDSFIDVNTNVQQSNGVSGDDSNEAAAMNENNERCIEHKRTILESHIGDRNANSLCEFQLLTTKTNFFNKEPTKAKQQEHPGYLEPQRELPSIPLQTYLTLKETHYNKDLFKDQWNELTNAKQGNKSEFSKQNQLYTIGPLFSLQHYLYSLTSSSQFSFNKAAYLKAYGHLKGTFAYWRKVKGDGNCFYRAVILRYIEKLILSQNKNKLKLLLCDIHLNLSNDELKEYYTVTKDIVISPEMVTTNLFMVLYLLRRHKVSDAYMYFIYCINKFSAFDYGLILYFRYKIKQYIQLNEKKYFSKEFDVLIGTLLPEQYGIEDDFFFDLFYSDFLLKNFIDAEKIVIYIVPYLLQTKINVIVNDDQFEGDNNKLLVFDYVDGRDSGKEEITLIMRKNHFDIGYTNEECKVFNEVYKDYNSIVAKLQTNVKQVLDGLTKEVDKKVKKELKPSATVVESNKSSGNNNNNNKVNEESFRLLNTEKKFYPNEQANAVSNKDDKGSSNNSNKINNKADKQSSNNNNNNSNNVNKDKINKLKESQVKGSKLPDNNNNNVNVSQQKSQSVPINQQSNPSSHCKQILQLREQKEKQITQKCSECQKDYQIPLTDIFHICSKCFSNKILTCYEQCLSSNTDINSIRDKLIFPFNNNTSSTTINGMLLYYTSYPNIDTSTTKLHEEFMKQLPKKKQQQQALHQSAYIKK